MEAWPAFEPVTATCSEVLAQFDDLTADEKKTYTLAGRIMSLRGHGKTMFANIQDRTGKLQIYVRSDELGQEKFENIQKFVDIGDIVSVSGYSFRTKMGEVTLHVHDMKLLSKSLHPLPEKFHGIADIEIKYRQRYLDLITNPESRERFKIRSRLVQGIRDFLNSYDFIEVETPMLHAIPGGAAAKPFITHHNALNDDFYLRIAPELFLKRLVVGGFERVYEINRNFRNEGISTKHNPEFTMLEFYMAHHDYLYIMNFVEKLLRNIIQQACGTLQLQYGDMSLDFSVPFERLSMEDAVIRYAPCTKEDLSAENIDKLLEKHHIKLENKNIPHGYKLAELFGKVAEPNLIQPTFITHYPIEISPLAKRDSQDPNIAARYELFIAGMELSNGFNELNDPFDQAQRFHDQVSARAAGDAEAHHFDADYVVALEHALPPTVGVGIGIDRLTMLVTNTTSIKDVILFPTLKRKEQA
jgi:lysyl-tRNA synthetase class 2